MAQIPYRVNLSSAIFPMTLAKSGKSVINPGMDQNFDKRVDPGASPMSVGIPQMIYCSNVLPTPEGYQSVIFRTTGNIDIGVPLTTVETIRLAVEVDETTVTPDIDVTDVGDQLSSWTTSPNDTAGADYRNVSQSATEGNPQPSYFTIFDRNEHIPAYFYKNYNIGNTGNLQLSWQVKFGGETALHSSTLNRFLVDSSGAGPAIKIDGVAATFGLYQTTGWGAFFTIGTALTESAIVGFDSTHIYECIISAVKNTDGTWTILATLNDLGVDPDVDPVTEVSTLAYTLSFTPGGYIGWSHETPINSLGGRFTTWIDNIHVQAEAPDVSYTSVSGITNIDVAFRTDNSAVWSHGNVDTFESHPVTVPIGFESPLRSDNFSTTSVRGQCYVCITGASGLTKIYHVTYDDVTPSLIFADATPTIAESLGLAFNINNVIGIVGAYNYLILLTPDSILWSSTTDITNFAPSLVSGAGSERVGNLKGDICFAKEHVSGFFIYTNGNALFCAYTGNARYPWQIKEIGGSSGYSFSQQVAGDTNSEIQYGISNSKNIQVLQQRTSELIAQEATNFLERSTTWDRYNSATGEFDVVTEGVSTLLPVDGRYRIWVALDRYVIIAYAYTETAQENFSFALVFDLLSRRYGKFALTFNTFLVSESSFCAVDYITGAKRKVIFDINVPDEPIDDERPRMLIGKLCAARDKMITIDELSVEAANSSSTDLLPSFTVSLFPSMNGKKFVYPAIVPTLNAEDSDGGLMSYWVRNTAYSFSIMVQGKFDLIGMDTKFHLAGGR